MINPLYFDTSVFGKTYYDVIQHHRDSFVRFCVKEYSLENYIALMCISAYKKSPSWKRLQTFYVAFLKGTDSPMEINVSRQQVALAASAAQAGPSSSKGFLGRTVMSNAPRNILDGLTAPVITNLSDTFSRYVSTGLDAEWRYGTNKVRQFFKVQSDGMKKLKSTTTNDQDIVKGVHILESGGFPMHHMGLTGVLQGL